MKRLGIGLAIGFLLMVASSATIAGDGAASMGIRVGDYWNYGSVVDGVEDSIDGTLEIEISDIESTEVNEFLVVTATYSGEYVGGSGVVGVHQEGEIHGVFVEKRLLSNFSLVEVSASFEMVITGNVQSFSVRMALRLAYSPALDDYILDNNPGLGGTLASRSMCVEEGWMDTEVEGSHINETIAFTELVTVTHQVASSNQTVEVPAGTFECYEVFKTENGSETGLDTSTCYYSDLVGNSVKVVTASNELGDRGNMELVSYSYLDRGSGESSPLSGSNLLVIGVAVVSVLVIVTLVLVGRKRGRPVAQLPAQQPPTETGGHSQPPP